MTSPLDGYKQFLDRLITVYESSGFSMQSFTHTDDPEREAVTHCFTKLSPEDIVLLDRLLKRAQLNGFIQVLDDLTNQIEHSQLTLTTTFGPLPKEPFGNELSLDFINRLEGEAWPDESVCPIHHIQLQLDHVPVVFGLKRYPSEYYGACLHLFPYAHAIVDGGCISTGENISQTVFYCQACRIALVDWNRTSGTRYGLPRNDTFIAHESQQDPDKKMCGG